jgi:ferric-dicitrate binding protein FerR (iron transport regulator)
MATQIEYEAALWVLQMESPEGLTPQQTEELKEWLARSSEHRREFRLLSYTEAVIARVHQLKHPS